MGFLGRLEEVTAEAYKSDFDVIDMQSDKQFTTITKMRLQWSYAVDTLREGISFQVKVADQKGKATMHNTEEDESNTTETDYDVSVPTVLLEISDERTDKASFVIKPKEVSIDKGGKVTVTFELV